MDIEQNIIDFSDQERARLQAVAETEPRESVSTLDVYQRTQDRIRDVNQKSYPKGSSAIVKTATYSVIDGEGGEGLAHAFRRAKEDVDVLEEKGERGRAMLRRQQYMEEYFLPALELVINSTSPDEVLNSEQALKELDKYVLLEGSGKGYTASYIRQAYGNQLGNVEGHSDASVRSGIRRINSLLDDGEVRTAFGIANKLKQQIDKGQNQASDMDYELISKVVTVYS